MLYFQELGSREKSPEIVDSFRFGHWESDFGTFWNHTHLYVMGHETLVNMEQEKQSDQTPLRLLTSKVPEKKIKSWTPRHRHPTQSQLIFWSTSLSSASISG